MRHNSDEITPLLRAIRLMERFFTGAREGPAELRRYLPPLQLRYIELLNDQFAPHAYDLARALVELEDRLATYRSKYLRLNATRRQRTRHTDGEGR